MQSGSGTPRRQSLAVTPSAGYYFSNYCYHDVMTSTPSPEGRWISMVRLGPKSQIVIPKEVRDLFGLAPGDSLLLMADRERGIALVDPAQYGDVIDRALGNGPDRPGQGELPTAARCGLRATMKTTVDQFCINVTDLEKSVHFYQEVLGLAVTHRIETPDFREEAICVANIQADGLSLRPLFTAALPNLRKPLLASAH